MSLSPFSARVSLIKLKIPFGMLWSDPIARYSPSKIVRAVPTVITGNPGFGNYIRPICGTLFWPTLSS
jgi:hypothetical protein